MESFGTERSRSFHSDEKGSPIDEKRDSADVVTDVSFQGDVYDDLRVIDMGEDGKERPIGIPLSLPLFKV